VRSYLARKSAVAGRTLTVFDVVGSTLTSLSVLGDVQTHFTQTAAHKHTTCQSPVNHTELLALVKAPSRGRTEHFSNIVADRGSCRSSCGRNKDRSDRAAGHSGLVQWRIQEINKEGAEY